MLRRSEVAGGKRTGPVTPTRFEWLLLDYFRYHWNPVEPADDTGKLFDETVDPRWKESTLVNFILASGNWFDSILFPLQPLTL